MGFKIVGTPGTARYLKRAGIVSESVDKIGDGSKESLLDWIRGGHVQMIINTTEGVTSYQDSLSIRQVALKYRVPLMTTISAADMALMAIQVLKEEGIRPTAIQDFCVL